MGKVYQDASNTDGSLVLEYESGGASNGQEVVSALRLLSDDVASQDYLEIFKHCKVFKDKSISHCEQRAQEFFEKAARLKEGRGYLELGKLYRFKDLMKAKGYTSRP